MVPVAVFALYLLAAVVVTVGAWRGPTSGWPAARRAEEQADLVSRLDPARSARLSFTTHNFGSPAGVNLCDEPLDATARGFSLAPGNLGGPIFGFNVLVVVGIVLSGLCGVVAIRRWSGDGFVLIMGGAVYAFSPYVVSHAALQLPGHSLGSATAPDRFTTPSRRSRRPPWQAGMALAISPRRSTAYFFEVLATSVVAAGVLMGSHGFHPP